jgi:hypothetical protein
MWIINVNKIDNLKSFSYTRHRVKRKKKMANQRMKTHLISITLIVAAMLLILPRPANAVDAGNFADLWGYLTNNNPYFDPAAPNGIITLGTTFSFDGSTLITFC